MEKKEMSEPLMKTFGWIRTRSRLIGNKRLIELVEKLNKDLSKAKIEENYFKN